jgi:hypothetical protein
MQHMIPFLLWQHLGDDIEAPRPVIYRYGERAAIAAA